jgi:uncharacterized membrane-anchored protein YitT (DUF2179 family)
MLFFKKKNEENIIKEIYKKDRFKRGISFVLGVLIVALAFNIFMLPNNIVYGVNL